MQNGVYRFCLTIPDRLYPFASYVEGERVRWQRSYDHTLADVRARLGAGQYGYKLMAYRQFYHFIGSLLFISFATYFSHHFFGNDVALPVLFIAAVIAISFQEFYVHPRHYGQRLPKSVIDWASWIVPIGIYFFLIR